MIDYKEMRRICLAPESKFWSLGQNVGTTIEPAIYIDNGSNVLAVAHLDFVPNTTHFRTVTVRKPKGYRRTLIFNGQLDDRLGAYIILSLLPSLGVLPDILLTTNEERGASTASLFQPPKQYNWMFQFDRSGTDVVMYQYKEQKYAKMLEDSGFKVGIGSYSDIADLGHLRCAGFNFGTGYYRNHEELAYAEAWEVEKMVTLFQRFWEKWHKVSMPSTAGTRTRYQHWDYGYGSYSYGSTTPTSTAYIKAKAPVVNEGPCDLCGTAEMLYWSKDLGCEVCARCKRDYETYARRTVEYEVCAICQKYYEVDPDAKASIDLCDECLTWYEDRLGNKEN